MLNTDQYSYARDNDSGGEEEDDDTTTSNVSQSKSTIRPYKKKVINHHRHHHLSKSSTLPKPLKGILKNKANQQLMIPHVQYPQLFPDGGTIDVLNDNFYTQFQEMAFIDPQQQQQLLPLNIMNCNGLEQAQQQAHCQTLPRHLDVVPFDTVPPCDDCLKRARYKGSYGTMCHGTSGAECVFMNTQDASSCLTSTFKSNTSLKSEEVQMKEGNISFNFKLKLQLQKLYY